MLAITGVYYSCLVWIELKYKFYMYKYLIFLLFMLLFSCKPQHIITQITDTKTIEKIVNDTITVQVRIPQESESVTVQCDSSFVETSIAYSKAKIDSNGNLHHMIANKDTIITKDTVYSYKEVTKEVFTTKDKIVEKKVVPWWCYMMIALSGGLLALLLVKLFR